jgi:hypothetical protein
MGNYTTMTDAERQAQSEKWRQERRDKAERLYMQRQRRAEKAADRVAARIRAERENKS